MADVSQRRDNPHSKINSRFITLVNPMSLAYTRKHWRHMLSPYLRIKPCWLEHTRQWRPPLPYFLGWELTKALEPMVSEAIETRRGRRDEHVKGKCLLNLLQFGAHTFRKIAIDRNGSRVTAAFCRGSLFLSTDPDKASTFNTAAMFLVSQDSVLLCLQILRRPEQ